VVEPALLMDESYKMAKTIMSKAPNSIIKAKRVIHQGVNLADAEALRLEAKEFGSLFSTDAIEGMKAFIEKRKPNWSN
jgi:enoyl-CoA hydratase/carnithine racemase